MRTLETALPFLSATLTFVFAVLVFERWTRKLHDHLLLCGADVRRLPQGHAERAGSRRGSPRRGGRVE